MLFFDVLIILAFAKGAVMLLEDAAYGVARKQSPRQRERAAHQAAERAAAAAGQPAPLPPGGAWGRTKAAVGGYLAGLAEDATANARARKRRAQARKAGTQAVDGIFVDFDGTHGFYSDCDLCSWSSRRFRIEANALAAGRKHTRTEHPEQYQQRPGIDGEPSQADGAGPQAGEASPSGRPQLRLIPGGAGDLADSHRWDCRECGAARTGFATDDTAWASYMQHTCPPADSAEKAAPTDPPAGGHEAGCRRCTWLQTGLSAEAARVAAATHTCSPSPSEQPTAAQDDLMDLAHATQDPGAGTPAGTGQQNPEGSTTVNLDATGPEEIRAAFSQAADTAGERSEEISGLAGVLAEAADRFENLQMAPTTVEHMREAAEAFQAAKALIDNAQESLQNALSDFNAKDGHVADTVADTGGNLANQEVLVGG